MGVSLIFGGDIAPLRSNPSEMFGNLAPVIRGADLAIGNLEFPLSHRGAPLRGKIYPHKGLPSSVDALVDAGFDAVNLANNHMLDYGEEALFDTLDLLDRASISRVGAGRDLTQAAAPVVLERGGLRIGFLGFTTTLPTGFAAGEGAPGVNPLRVLTSYRPSINLAEYPGSPAVVDTWPVAEDLACLVADIRKLKEISDVVLVYGHWGTSMTETVHDFQRTIAHAAIDAGAAALFGGHQHIVSAVEFYRGCPIVHGMGNLVFDFVAPFFTEATKRTIVFSAEISASGLSDCRLICCRTGVNGPVEMLSPKEGEGAELAATLARLSEPLGTALTVGTNDIAVRAR
jgi:poly-gamma-glutamate capsule biosynthesis protein CapA/YwtB (metallophosphatase superfamily)